MGCTLLFSSSVKGEYSWFGRWESLQWTEGKGPIPEGWYFADPSRTQKWSDISTLNQIASTISPAYAFLTGQKLGAWPGGTIAWGKYRVPLSPSQVGNRGNFFIHGGAVPGSIGCIDLTKYNKNFFNVFSSHTRQLKLQVKY